LTLFLCVSKKIFLVQFTHCQLFKHFEFCLQAAPGKEWTPFANLCSRPVWQELWKRDILFHPFVYWSD